MRVHDVEQGSEAWRLIRAGKVTASRVADVVRKTRTRKGGWAESRAKYEAQLICERLTGAPSEYFKSGPMQRGNDVEPQARAAYQFDRGVSVEQVGFVDHPRIAMAGASPDGLVLDAGMTQFKCPNTETHIYILINNVIDDDYLIQMQWEMACAGRLWCDFVSYDNRLPHHMRLKVIRVHRDDEVIVELEAAVSTFLAELDVKIAQLEAACSVEETELVDA